MALVYGYRQHFKPPYNENLIDLIPEASCWYDEMSTPFYLAMKKKTGLEDYELQDYLDSLMVELFENWPLVDWIEMIYQDWADSNARHNRFRNYIFLIMAVMVTMPAIIQAIQAATAAATAASLKALSTLSQLNLGIEAFIGSLATSLKAFLTAIHFDTLVGIHKIAFLVSDDYRAVVHNIYSELSRVSNALGFGPYFLLLALQNTRNLVLDISTSLGMRYDLAEVNWLSTLQGYLGNFAGAAHRYANNPEAFFFDLSRWVERDALDLKGAFIEGLVKTIENATDSIEQVVNEVTVIRDGLAELIMDLPTSIRNQLEPAIMPYIQRFDTFISEKFDPYKQELDSIITKIQSLQNTQKTKVTTLIDRLKRPGDYLSEINNFEGMDRLSQTRQIADLASEEWSDDADDGETYASELEAELGLIRNALEHVSLTPLEMPQELESPGRPAGSPAEPKETWNVGDY